MESLLKIWNHPNEPLSLYPKALSFDNPLDFSTKPLTSLIKKRRGYVKSFLISGLALCITYLICLFSKAYWAAENSANMS